MKYNLIFFLLITHVGANCQTAAPDTAFLNLSVANTIKRYEQSVANQHLYLTGSAYVEPRQTNDEHAFFITNEWVTGSINYDGQSFNNVPLLYDLTIDQVITESVHSNLLVFPSGKISSFTIGNHYFKYIHKSFGGNTLPRSGFYEILYDGPTMVVCQRIKAVQEVIEGQAVQIYYKDRSRVFILKNDRFFPVKSESSVLKVLGDKKNQTASFIRKNKIRLKRNPQAFGLVAQFYDSLIESNR
jgi:hypothetical protein